MRAISVIILAGVLASCGPASVAPPPAPGPSAAPATDKWLGKWPGVEGTYLQLDPGAAPGLYKLTIADLDGPQTFAATAAGDSINFSRNNVIETIRAGDGKATGMKWLTEKPDCLVIKTGEGFCR